MVEGLTPATEEISDWAELGEAWRLRAEADVDARASERTTKAEGETMMSNNTKDAVGFAVKATFRRFQIV